MYRKPNVSRYIVKWYIVAPLAGGRPSFRYHATRWRHRPTYCIMHCKDDQCRAPWRHWPNCAGGRPTFGITPYRNVTDRIVQVCDPVLVSRHTMTSPTDLLHHALQGQAVSCPMTEFCRCSTDFLKSRPIHFSWMQLRACNCIDNETMQYHFILEWQRLHFYRIVVQMFVSYRNKCPNLHRPLRIRFSREWQCFWNVWHPVRSNNVDTTFVCFLLCHCKVWCGVVGVFRIFHSPIAIENISRQGDLSFQRFNLIRIKMVYTS